MRTRTRVRLYRGSIEAAAEERFRADAVWALRDGWRPTEWRWDGRALRVVYEQGRPDPLAMDDPGRRPPSFRRFLRRRTV
jgi:hypothetical protein